MQSLWKRLPGDQRRTLLTCFFSLFASGTATLMIGSVLPDMKAAYLLTDTQSGLMISAHSIGTLVAGIIGGLLPLLLGRRRSVVLLSAFALVGYVPMMLWGNPAFLVFCFICTGIGRGALTHFNNDTVSRISSGNPAAVNLLHASFAVGALTAPMAFLLWNGLVGWKGALCYVVCLCAFSMTGLSLLRLEDDRPDRRDRRHSTLVFLKNPGFLILGVMLLLYMCAEYAINGWLVTFLQHKEPLRAALPDASAVAAYSQAMATLFWVVILLGRLSCAAIAAKAPAKPLMAGMSLAAMGFFVMMLLGESLTMVSISIAGLGFCMAGISPMIYASAGIFTNTYTMGTSMLLVMGALGSILMPLVVGFTAETFGFTSGMATILAAMVLLVGCAVLNMKGKN